MVQPTYTLELKYLPKYRLIGGIDEAGRGPLAGPVVAACVVLDPKKTGQRRSKSKWWNAVRDSKLLSAKARQSLVEIIKANSLCWGVGVVASELVDKLNVHHASLQAMHKAALACDPDPRFVLIDGKHRITGAAYRQRPVIDGDALVLSIAAASIIAKVVRDSLMDAFHEKYPEYGFNKHKGYGTPLHLAMLKKYGPCPIHRKTFLRTLNSKS